jgi:hypothetical protein
MLRGSAITKVHSSSPCPSVSRIGFERIFDGPASETDVHLWTPAALGALYNSDEFSGSHSHEISLINEADEQAYSAEHLSGEGDEDN